MIRLSCIPSPCRRSGSRTSCRHRQHQGQVRPALFPVVHGIVSGYIPAVVSHSIECNLDASPCSIGIADHAAQVIRSKGRVETVCRSLHDYMSCIICYREIPPVESRPVYSRIHPFHSIFGQVAAHVVTCPENFYVRIQDFPVYRQIAVRPGLAQSLE